MLSLLLLFECMELLCNDEVEQQRGKCQSGILGVRGGDVWIPLILRPRDWTSHWQAERRRNGGFALFFQADGSGEGAKCEPRLQIGIQTPCIQINTVKARYSFYSSLSMFVVPHESNKREERKKHCFQSNLLLEHARNPRQVTIRIIVHLNVTWVLPFPSSKDIRLDVPIHTTPDECAPSRIQTSYSHVSPLHTASKAHPSRDNQYVPCTIAVAGSLFLTCSQNTKLPPGLNSFHTSLITLFTSPTEHNV